MVGIQMGDHENGWFAGRRPSDNTDRVAIPICCALIDLVVRQPLQEDRGPFFFPECGRRGLSDQNDIGDDGILERFDNVDKFRD